jgi:predicted nucleic acid-binding protein
VARPKSGAKYKAWYKTVDTSALIAVIGNEESKHRIIEITEGYSLCSPVSVHWEIGNAFSAMFKRNKLSIDMAKQALAIYREIPIKFIDVPLEKMLEITRTHNIYAYDAYLIQCAQQTSTSLLTLDKRLKNVANKMGISVLETKS